MVTRAGGEDHWPRCAACNTAWRNEQQTPTHAGRPVATRRGPAYTAESSTANCAEPQATMFQRITSGTPWDDGKWCAKPAATGPRARTWWARSAEAAVTNLLQGQEQSATRSRQTALVGASRVLDTCRYTRCGLRGQ